MVDRTELRTGAVVGVLDDSGVSGASGDDIFINPIPEPVARRCCSGLN